MGRLIYTPALAIALLIQIWAHLKRYCLAPHEAPVRFLIDSDGKAHCGKYCQRLSIEHVKHP